MGEVWTHEDVWYVVDDGDPPVLTTGAKKDGWFMARKTASTPMLPARGPLTVVTQEGEYRLPDGWRGFIAVDSAGFPYPIEGAEWRRTYERVEEGVATV